MHIRSKQYWCHHTEALSFLHNHFHDTSSFDDTYWSSWGLGTHNKGNPYYLLYVFYQNNTFYIYSMYRNSIRTQTSTKPSDGLISKWWLQIHLFFYTLFTCNGFHKCPFRKILFILSKSTIVYKYLSQGMRFWNGWSSSLGKGQSQRQ